MTANLDRFEVIAAEILELRKDSNVIREALLNQGEALVLQGQQNAVIMKSLNRNTEALGILIQDMKARQNGQA